MTENEKIIIADNLKSLEEVKSDFIYIKKDLKPNLVIPFNRLYGLICDVGDSSPKYSGVPSELISFVDLGIDTPKVYYKENNEIVYFSPVQYDTKENVLNIVKFFNKLYSTKFVIYTSSTIYQRVKEFANKNIVFNCYNDPKKLSFSASIVISYGYCVRELIRQKMPTIVVGHYGLGGWVTPDNIGFLANENFRGRPSGSFNEYIPLSILVDEIVEIKNSKHLTTVLEQNIVQLERVSNKSFIDTLDNTISRYKEIHENLRDFSKRRFLKPKLASNVSMIKNKQNLLVVRNELHDVLFSLDEIEQELLHDLNGQISCYELRKKYKMESETFWEIIISIWESKAITLSL